MTEKRTIISGTGSYIPTEIVSNKEFVAHRFYAEDHQPIETSPDEIVKKFKQITGIAERRYAATDLNTSDIATIAAQKAIQDSGIDPESIDQLIVAHNFGNVIKNTIQTDIFANNRVVPTGHGPPGTYRGTGSSKSRF